jgi:hypothetical protein
MERTVANPEMVSHISVQHSYRGDVEQTLSSQVRYLVNHSSLRARTRQRPSSEHIGNMSGDVSFYPNYSLS